MVMDGDRKGLLAPPAIETLVRPEPMAGFYNVEQRPFARGKFATVRRCRHRESGIDYAAKFMRKRRRANDVRAELLHEAAVLDLSRSCQRIVRLHEAFETSSELILVLELAAGGELQRLIDEEETLKEKEVVRLMRQLLEAILFLHDRNIAHLDIKPQNILLTGTYPDCEVKLCDFGISRVMAPGVEIREIVGTPDYVAPEILSYDPITLSTDMWSLGVVVYVLLSGHSPFAGDTKQETYCNISQAELDFPVDLFADCSLLARDFIRKLLIKEPKHRMSARDCLKHPWIQNPDCSAKASPMLSLRPPLVENLDLPKRLKLSEGLLVGDAVMC